MKVDYSSNATVASCGLAREWQVCHDCSLGGRGFMAAPRYGIITKDTALPGGEKQTFVIFKRLEIIINESSWSVIFSSGE